MNINSVLLIPGFIAGLAAGSFLNVVIYRVPRGKSIVRPRSSCPNCKRVIRWYENIPLFSYIFLGGRCAGCRKRIAVRYPVIEFLGGIFASLSLYRLGLSIDLLVIYPFIMALLAVTMIDWDYQIIPNVISLPFIIIGILWAVAGNRISIIYSVSGAFVGGGSLYLTGVVYKGLRKVDGMGGGGCKTDGDDRGVFGNKVSFAGNSYSFFLWCNLWSISASEGWDKSDGRTLRILSGAGRHSLSLPWKLSPEVVFSPVPVIYQIA